MKETEFIERYKEERVFYEAWGEFIKNEIITKCNEENIIFRITPSCRIKDEKSLTEKAFYRDKDYKNPYDEITDKVGIRFVVLLADEIKRIEKIIESIECWNYSKDRDYVKEIENSPLVFEYQSVHYVLRNKKKFSYENIEILENTPCEVQIRTLLQHSYSELTHDLIYKPQIMATSDLYRLTARSMALIETTDCIFSDVNSQILKKSQISNKLIKDLLELYNSFSKTKLETKINYKIVDSLESIEPSLSIATIKEFLEAKPFIKTCIIKRAKEKMLFSQPIVILIYYLANKYPYKLKEKWPLLPDEISCIYSELGIALDS